MQLNYNPRIVKRDKGPIDILIVGVIDKDIVKMIPMNLQYVSSH